MDDLDEQQLRMLELNRARSESVPPLRIEMATFNNLITSHNSHLADYENISLDSPRSMSPQPSSKGASFGGVSVLPDFGIGAHAPSSVLFDALSLHSSMVPDDTAKKCVNT